MSYSREKITQRLDSDGVTRLYYRVQLYNVGKRVKGHYLDPHDYDCKSVETTFWYNQSRISPPSDHDPVYAYYGPINVDALTPNDMDGMAAADLDRARNKAYAKFMDKMKDTAQNANNALEAGQSARQILQHVSTIAGAYESVRHGDIVGAAKKLGVSVSGSKEQRIKKRAKQASDRWLELHFGWQPLVQDIGSSIDILQGTGKSGPSLVRQKAGAGFSGAQHSEISSSPFGYNDTGSDSYRWSGGVVMGGMVGVENPNLAIANQMGFVNPLSVAWEAVPFSFVVDWFSNVGQCLSAMTDMWGYQLHYGYTSSRVETYLTHRYRRVTTDANSQLVEEEDYGIKMYHQGRLGGLVSPVFRFTPFKGFSLARGATAISLLVQQMKH
jgi:hypothetical protein